MGGRYSDEWHVQHLKDPRAVVPESIMPTYPFLAERDLKAGDMSGDLTALARVGAAVVLDHWPEASRWPDLLEDSLALRASDRRALQGEGLRAAGDWLLGLAAELEART